MIAGAKGYTLIELSLVLALIGITLALGLPRFRQALLTDTLKSSARKIIGSVEQLRERAVREQADWNLCFDFENNAFWNEKAEEATVSSAAISNEELQQNLKHAVKLAADVRISDIWLRTHGKISEGILKVRFTKKGYVNQTMIHLVDESGRQLSLFLEPFLGTIKLTEGYAEVE